MYQISTADHVRLIDWLTRLKECDDAELMIYYEKCLRYLKNRSGKNRPIGKKDLTYYVFLVREYIESILNDDDCQAFESEIKDIKAGEIYTDDFEADDIALIRFILDGKARAVLED